MIFRLLSAIFIAIFLNFNAYTKPLLCKKLKEQAALYCNDGKFYKVTNEVDSAQKGVASSIMSGNDKIDDTVRIDFDTDRDTKERTTGSAAIQR